MFALAALLNGVALVASAPLPRFPTHLEPEHPLRPSLHERERLRALLAAARWSMLLSYTLLFLLAPLLPEVFARLGLGLVQAVHAVFALTAPTGSAHRSSTTRRALSATLGFRASARWDRCSPRSRADAAEMADSGGRRGRYARAKWVQAGEDSPRLEAGAASPVVSGRTIQPSPACSRPPRCTLHSKQRNAWSPSA
nr:MAG: hypothetical protein DIU78_18880 [Pseudomonadota bacterium]